VFRAVVPLLAQDMAHRLTTWAFRLCSYFNLWPRMAQMAYCDTRLVTEKRSRMLGDSSHPGPDLPGL
jgi:hypothetical protein